MTNINEGLELLKQLDKELRSFMVRYTALINKSKTHIPIEHAKLAKFIPLAERLADNEDIILQVNGVAYLSAIDLMLNGVNCKQEEVTHIDDVITFLYYFIKLTENAEGTINLYTFTEDSGIGGINVVKDEDAE